MVRVHAAMQGDRPAGQPGGPRQEHLQGPPAQGVGRGGAPQRGHPHAREGDLPRGGGHDGGPGRHRHPDRSRGPQGCRGDLRRPRRAAGNGGALLQDAGGRRADRIQQAPEDVRLALLAQGWQRVQPRDRDCTVHLRM